MTLIRNVELFYMHM